MKGLCTGIAAMLVAGSAIADDRQLPLCGADYGRPSPSGNTLLFARDLSVPPYLVGSSDAGVYSLDCLLSPARPDTCLTGRTPVGADEASGIAWTSDGNLFVWGPTSAAAYDAHLQRIGRPVRRPNIIPIVSTQGAPSPQTLMQALRQRYGRQRLLSVRPGRPTEGFVIDQGYLRAPLPNSRATTPTGAGSGVVRRVIIGVGDGAPVLRGNILIARPPAPELESALRAPAVSLTPVTEAVTGELLGFTAFPDTISLPGRADLAVSLQELVRQDLERDPELMVRGLEVNAQAGVAAIAYVRRLTTRAFRIVRLGPAPQSRLITCPTPDFFSSAILLEGYPGALRTRLTTFGDESWPIPALVLSGKRRDAVALMLHGGPGGLHFNGTLFPRWRRMLDWGYEVVVPAASGSGDFGPLARARLIEDPVAALQQDAAHIVESLSGPEFSDRDVVIYAESYGGPLALEVARRLGDRASRVVLIAPLLEYRPPSEWFNDPEYALAAERKEMGFVDSASRERFFAWTEALVTGQLNARPTLIVYGERDARIARALVERTAETGTAEVAVLPRWGHDAIAVAPDTITLVERLLAPPGPP